MSIHSELHRKMPQKNNTPIFVVAAAVLVVVILVILIVSAFGKDDKDNVSSVLASSEIKSSSAITSSEISSEVSTSSKEVSSKDTSSKEISSKQNSSKVVTSQKVSSASTSSAPVQAPSSEPAPALEAMVPNGDWRLVIANKQYPLPESYKIDVSYVSGNYRLDSRIATAYKEMIAAAKNDGITLVIISGFRTYQGQTTLFNNKVNQYINRGYSRDKAKELAAQYVAPPGTSEHLTGLAVDLISSNWYSYNSDLNSNFENTKEFEWLYNNCARFGFCLRYPKDKVAITGYNYEPWHYRYVGVEAATEIMNRKICLEEYVGL